MSSGNDFIQSAIDLKMKGNLTEVDLRNIMSRSYYGAYHCCQDLVQGQSISLGAGTTHKKLIDALKAHTNKQIRKIGGQLGQCHKYRVHADYHLSLSVSSRDMGLQLKKTVQIADSVSQLLSDKSA